MIAVERDTRRAAKMYQMYATFFDKAEKERRWNPFEDIPWDRINPDVTDNLALCAETFLCVEAYLPDYIAGGLNVVRPSFGQLWFTANWGYEESKHSTALLEWLLRSKKRTEEQVFDLMHTLHEKRWTLPFNTSRQMTIYGCFQEQATFVIYCRQEQVAIEQKCEALRAVYRYAARDEVAHARFYMEVVKVLLEEDRDGTLLDIAHVSKHFQMPGVGVVPDYEARISVMREESNVDRDLFLQKVFFPTLKLLGVTRQDLVAVSAKARAERTAAAAT
ncbi:MAG: acyl-ACP desaturase [Deltaproteobacteria bacterium]|nr:acyl-ACP desaturase [Deltaproteobacteria bacterium]